MKKRTVQECLAEIAPELYEDFVSSTVNSFLLGFSPQLVRANPQLKQTAKTGKNATQSATNLLREEILHPMSGQRLSADVMAEASAASSARFPTGSLGGRRAALCGSLSCGAWGWRRSQGRLGTASGSALGTAREVPSRSRFVSTNSSCAAWAVSRSQPRAGVSGQGSDLIRVGGTQTSKGISSQHSPFSPNSERFDLYPHNLCSKQSGKTIK